MRHDGGRPVPGSRRRAPGRRRRGGRARGRPRRGAAWPGDDRPAHPEGPGHHRPVPGEARVIASHLAQVGHLLWIAGLAGAVFLMGLAVMRGWS
ncbi:hypothetical protein Maq22A_c27810 [Methylobacterium aquaticum]|uniref:Uncharacterized protein n=1 Tax=Methylobacterium aquaticum TaxID=270351 RepID=A0A1Y0Z8M9_9HYPH|nr:hypothetical protein Maq22A_c27810 [Methylobacterium aquaticum]